LLQSVYPGSWVLIYEKGYHVHDKAMSSITTKVKGIMLAKYALEDNEMPQVADATDLVYPALGYNEFLIMTNRIKTIGQKATSCPGDGLESICNLDKDCVPFTPSPSKIGLYTGKCLKLPLGVGVCEIYAWCPLENDTRVLKNGQRTLDFIRNYTVYIKNDIEFPKFKVRRYDPEHPIDKYCPIFKMSTIFDQTGVDMKTIFKGGVMGIQIQWKCDLDYGIKNCNPQYSFTNIEDRHENAGGFNFR
uniref:ATP receptor n=1 Tax=Schistocephalus solidus TaxID=70667 RepID=A0A183SP57_SCHSO